MQNKQKGFITPMIIVIVILLLIGSGIYLYKTNKQKTIINNVASTTNNIVGNDKDIHGCIGSAGYSWCEIKSKCLRPWEEKCEITPIKTVGTTTIKTQTPTTTVSATVKSYSITDISTHNSMSSCWTAIDGKVYDITNFISLHPAGISKIMKGCGVDSTNMFNQVGAHSISSLSNSILGILK